VIVVLVGKLQVWRLFPIVMKRVRCRQYGFPSAVEKSALGFPTELLFHITVRREARKLGHFA
jgi:hypothetical protein